MNKDIHRLRMFAGPNGSGKSTLKSMLRLQAYPLFAKKYSANMKRKYQVIGNTKRLWAI